MTAFLAWWADHWPLAVVGAIVLLLLPEWFIWYSAWLLRRSKAKKATPMEEVPDVRERRREP